MWPTHWGWKGLHLPTTNPPSSLRLGGHPIFLLSKPPRQSRPRHVMLGEPGHVFPCLSGFPGAEPSPGPLPSPAGIWQHNQSHSMLFCYSSSWRPSFRSSSPTLFIQDFSRFMRTGLSARKEGVITSALRVLCPVSDVHTPFIRVPPLPSICAREKEM